jgi:hypothetical protein
MSFSLDDLVAAVEAPSEDGPKPKYLVVGVPCKTSEELTKLGRIEAKIMKLNLPMVFIGIGEDGAPFLENSKEFPPGIDSAAKAIRWVQMQRRKIT